MWTFFSFHLSAWFRNGHALLHNITWTLLSTWLLRGRTSSPTRSPISISDAQFPSLFPILPKSPQNVPFPHDGLTPAISPPDSRSTTPIYSTRIPPRSTRPRPPIPAFTILSARSRPRLPSTSTPSPWSRWDVSNGTSSEPSSAMFCSEARFFNSPSHGFWARVAWWCGVVWCGNEKQGLYLDQLAWVATCFYFFGSRGCGIRGWTTESHETHSTRLPPISTPPVFFFPV